VRGYFYIATAALFWGISASLGRAVFTGKLTFDGETISPIGPLILAQTRTTLSVLLLAPVLLLLRGPRGLTMQPRDLLHCVVLGTLGVAASNYFYYLAIDLTNVATAIVLQYTAPVWVLLYMIARRYQRATLKRVAAVALAVAGSAIAIDVFGSGQLKLNGRGVAAAQMAALSFAFYNVYGHALLERYDRWRVLLYALAGAALFWLVISSPRAVLAAGYSAAQWQFMLLFAVISILVPFAFYFSGLRHLDATRAVVTSSLEPMFAILIAALSLGEALGWLQAAGVALVLVGTVIVQFPEREDQRMRPASAAE
jgi:drug/metabolite transporter (DMT)-like permease